MFPAGGGGPRGLGWGTPLAGEAGGAPLTSYFWRFSFSPYSNLSISSWYRASQSSLALSLGPQGRLGDGPGSSQRPPPGGGRGPHLSLSSLRWSMLRGFLRSASTFFFISRAVCFLPRF